MVDYRTRDTTQTPTMTNFVDGPMVVVEGPGPNDKALCQIWRDHDRRSVGKTKRAAVDIVDRGPEAQMAIKSRVIAAPLYMPSITPPSLEPRFDALSRT